MAHSDVWKVVLAAPDCSMSTPLLLLGLLTQAWTCAWMSTEMMAEALVKDLKVGPKAPPMLFQVTVASSHTVLTRWRLAVAAPVLVWWRLSPALTMVAPAGRKVRSNLSTAWVGVAGTVEVPPLTIMNE